MKSYIIIFNCIIILVSFVLLGFIGESYSSTIQLLSIILASCSLLSYLINNLQCNLLKGIYLRASFLFVLGYIIVYFQCNIDVLCGFIKTTDDFIFAKYGIINKSCLYSVIGLSSFVLGNAVGLSKIQVKKRILKTVAISDIFYFFLSVMLVTFVAIFMYYNAITILSGNYYYNQTTIEDSAGSLSNYSNVMIYVCIFLTLACKSYNYNILKEKMSFLKFIWKNGLLFNISVLIYLAFVFMTGDRGPLIAITLAHIISYQTASKFKIKPLRLFFIAIAAGFIIAAIGQVRSTSNLVSLNEIFNSDLESTPSILPVTQEMARSYNTFSYSVWSVPEKIDNFYGVMQLRDITYSVPFMYRLFPFLFSKNDSFNSSSNFCTYLIQGANSTYGNGSSVLVNAYVDFGLIGIVLIMLLIGFAIVKIDYELYYTSSFQWSIVAVIFFSFSLYLSRSNVYMPLYYILPSLIFISLVKPFIVKRVNNGFRNKILNRNVY